MSREHLRTGSRDEHVVEVVSVVQMKEVCLEFLTKVVFFQKELRRVLQEMIHVNILSL